MDSYLRLTREELLDTAIQTKMRNMKNQQLIDKPSAREVDTLDSMALSSLILPSKSFSFDYLSI
jgi:hypothetical protein